MLYYAITRSTRIGAFVEIPTYLSVYASISKINKPPNYEIFPTTYEVVPATFYVLIYQLFHINHSCWEYELYNICQLYCLHVCRRFRLVTFVDATVRTFVDGYIDTFVNFLTFVDGNALFCYVCRWLYSYPCWHVCRRTRCPLCTGWRCIMPSTYAETGRAIYTQ